MKKYMKLMLMFLGVSLFFSCSDIINDAYSDVSGAPSAENKTTGEQKIFSADDVNFTMIYVPAKRFNSTCSDSVSSEVKSSYWIGETETTYRLWYAVRKWASSKYIFTNNGVDGNDGSGGDVADDRKDLPVAIISWRDAIVWCNALTEWYNEKNNTNYACVYCSDGVPIRSSHDSNAGVCDNVVPDENATGFRLPTGVEWELAARYVADNNNDGDICDGNESYPGFCISGMFIQYNDNANYKLIEDYAVFGEDYLWNYTTVVSTAKVKSKLKNALNMYDVGGNVAEWCFEETIDEGILYKKIRGGSYAGSVQNCCVGRSLSYTPASIDYGIGFRIAKSN